MFTFKLIWMCFEDAFKLRTCSVWVNTRTYGVKQSKILVENDFYKYVLEICSAVFRGVMLFALCKCSDEPWLVYSYKYLQDLWSLDQMLICQKIIWVKTLFIILHSLSILVVFHFKNNQIFSKGMDTIPMWFWWQIVYKQWIGEMISAWISPSFICINYLVNILK